VNSSQELNPGEIHPRFPEAPSDTAYRSGGVRPQKGKRVDVPAQTSAIELVCEGRLEGCVGFVQPVQVEVG